MDAPRSLWRPWLGALAVVVPLAAMPALAQAKAYRFKVNITVDQQTIWHQKVRNPATGEGWCGTRDVHYLYEGRGSGDLEAKRRGARTKFTGTKKFLQSGLIRVPGEVYARAKTVSVKQVGTPDAGCTIPEPIKSPYESEGCRVVRKGHAKAFLMAFKGRLLLTGGFYRNDGKGCSDPSYYTGAIGYAGKAKRHDLNHLIRSKKVRSITLWAKKLDYPFKLKDLSDWGGNTTEVFAEGVGDAKWRVKLTRIYK